MFAERKRTFVVSWLATSVVLCVLMASAIFPTRGVDSPKSQHSTSAPSQRPRSPQADSGGGGGGNRPGSSSLGAQSSRPVVPALGVVIFVFTISTAVLWILTKTIMPPAPGDGNINVPPVAQFTAKLQKFGGAITVSAAGVLGAFFAICTLTVGMILIFNRFLDF
jgi:hypothetical protein